LAITAGGVPFGAPMPEPSARLVARHRLGDGRHAGKLVRRRVGRHREGAQLAAADMLDRRRQVVEDHVDGAGNEIGQRRAGAAIGHMRHLDAGHRHQHLARQMHRGTVAGRGHVILPGFALA
jgi:hypothetical protein